MNLDDLTEEDANRIREMLDKKFPQAHACIDCVYSANDDVNWCNAFWARKRSVRSAYGDKKCPGFKPKPARLQLLKRWFGREE